MASITTNLDCRLLCASVVTYGIGPGKPPLSADKPYYDAVGFKAPPVAFQAGVDDINAALVGTNNDGVIVAFRGTLPLDFHDLTTLLDWLNDLNAEPLAVPGIPGRVHEGFWKSLDSLWDGIAAELERQLEAAGPRTPVYVTGHSKGGSMAHLAAMRLSLSEQIKPKAVVSFAGARPGNGDFASAYDAAIDATRYEYQDDIVPHLPPSSVLLDILSAIPLIGKHFKALARHGYASVGTLKFINWKGQTVNESRGLELERAGHLAKLIVEGQFERIAGDHSSACGGGYMSHVCPTALCPKT